MFKKGFLKKIWTARYVFESSHQILANVYLFLSLKMSSSKTPVVSCSIKELKFFELTSSENSLWNSKDGNNMMSVIGNSVFSVIFSQFVQNYTITQKVPSGTFQSLFRGSIDNCPRRSSIVKDWIEVGASECRKIGR